MTTNQIVDLARSALQAALLTGAPILLIAMVVSLLISVVQTLTSVQDATVSTVPRLAAVAAAAFLLLPWMLRVLVRFTVGLFSDFHPYVR